jgi:NMD protein affecting ribosome stability and mRNA decay
MTVVVWCVRCDHGVTRLITTPAGVTFRRCGSCGLELSIASENRRRRSTVRLFLRGAARLQRPRSSARSSAAQPYRLGPAESD